MLVHIFSACDHLNFFSDISDADAALLVALADEFGDLSSACQELRHNEGRVEEFERCKELCDYVQTHKVSGPPSISMYE